MKLKTHVAGWLLVIALFSAGYFFLRISTTRTLEHRFAEEIVDVRSNHGDVLEVATMESAASYTENDKLEIRMLGVPVNLGTTSAYLTLPVTYRFHILLSGHWKIKEWPDRIVVTAPRIRASQPPAPDVSRALYLGSNGWARFDKEDVKKRLDALVSGDLRLRATRYSFSNIVRDRARESVAAFLTQRFSVLRPSGQKKPLVVQFEDEPTPAATPTSG